MPRVVLDRVVQEPEPPAGASRQAQHRAVLQKRRFERTLPADAVQVVRLPRGAGPGLGDEPVAADFQQRRPRRDHPETGVVDERVRGDVTGHVPAGLRLVVPHRREHPRQQVAVQLRLQLRRPVLRVRGGDGVDPRFAVALPPRRPEGRAVAGPGPVFRFLQVNGGRAGVQGPPDAGDEVIRVGAGGADVETVAAVGDHVAVDFPLIFAGVVGPVEVAAVVVAVIAPRGTGHQVRVVPAVPPAFQAGGQVVAEAVHEGRVRVQVQVRGPRPGGLEDEPLLTDRPVRDAPAAGRRGGRGEREQRDERAAHRRVRSGSGVGGADAGP